MDLQLAGKTAIVTGASRGIGRAIATALVGEGVSLAIVARSRDGLEQLNSSLGSDCLIQPVDLTEPGAPAAITDATLARFGRIDFLVNNAGATKRGDFRSLTDHDWTDGFSLKFFAAMRLCRSAWPHLVRSQGAIANIVGIRGRIADADFLIGGSVNAAVMYLTKALADRGVREGVRVNAINPGLISTERLQGRIKQYAAANNIDDATAAQRMLSDLGIARFGTPEEIAAVVCVLLSPIIGYVQGAILDADGGENRTL